MKKHYLSVTCLLLSLTLFVNTAYGATITTSQTTLYPEDDYASDEPLPADAHRVITIEYDDESESTSYVDSFVIKENIGDEESSITPLSINEVRYTVSSDKYKDQPLFNMPFDLYMKKNILSFYEDGQYFNQGVNSSKYLGTCSEACEATVMNRLFNTNVYTENNMLQFSALVHQCVTDRSTEQNGGQSPMQMENVFNNIGNLTGDNVSAKYYVNSDVPDPLMCARLLEDGKQVIMGVDSYVLWDMTPEEAASYGIPKYWESNHWIVLSQPTYDVNNNLNGFYIVDSSGYGVNYVSLQKYNTMVYGPTFTEIEYPAACVVERLHDSNEQVFKTGE